MLMRITIASLLIIIMQTSFALESITRDELQKLPVKRLVLPTGDVYLQRDIAIIERIFGGNMKAKTKAYKSRVHDIALPIEYLSRPHPSVNTIKRYFKLAEEEFGVPAQVLAAIAQVETNWTHYGPSVDRGWGIMHLVSNNYVNTLEEAADLLGEDPQALKDDILSNIRGAAALIAHYAAPYRHQITRLDDWFPFIEKYSALATPALRELQATTYLTVLKEGRFASTIWNEKVEIKAHPEINFQRFLNHNGGNLAITNSNVTAQATIQSSAVDYPSAVAAFTSCNYSSGRSADIDTWTNHWIGVGTYAGAISWFQNCDAKVSAHFVIRAADGQIAQVVNISNTAWHAGASGYNNNSRSIGIEHEATADNPDLWYSDAMLKNSAEMARYFADQENIPHSLHVVPGIAGHNEMPGTSTACPGNLPWSDWYVYFQGSNNGGGNDDDNDSDDDLEFEWKPGCIIRGTCFQ